MSLLWDAIYFSGPAKVRKSDHTLVIGPSWIGDMVMAQALFKAIKAHHPDTTLDVLAPEWSRSLTDRMPEVANSLVLPFKHGELKIFQRYALAKMLKNKKYQRCYVLPNSFKSALIPFWAKIPQRIGWRGEWRVVLLNDLRWLDKKQYPRMVDRYIALAFDKVHSTELPAYRPSLNTSLKDIEKALQAHNLTRENPIVVLCPGAEFGSSKRWPADYYAALADYYCRQGWQVWIMGSAKDSQCATLIKQHAKSHLIDLTGKTNLAQAIDLMSLANLVVSNDSGLMHIASALQRPLVAVYGSSDPSFTPPLSDNVAIVRSNLACSPCFKRECPLQHHRCMKEISVNEVLEAAGRVEGK